MQLCRTCKSKPAVTICLKGRLCFACGNHCHKDYQHPVEFIRHCDDSIKTQHRTIKSTSIITTKSLKELPKRITKVSSKLCFTRIKNQISAVRSRKTTESAWADLRDKENSHKTQNRQQQSKKSIQQCKKSIGIMTFNESTKSQEPSQLLVLKKKVSKQQELIKLLTQKLKREKGEKQSLRKNYEQKLKFIRNLRQ